MTIVDMLGQSGVLTFLGMGIVFSFLILLIISVSVACKIIQALGGGTDAGSSSPAGAPKTSAAKTSAVTAAITAAVSEYRKINP